MSGTAPEGVMDEQRVAAIRERRERACGMGFASYSPDLHFGKPERAKDGRDLIDLDVPWLLDALAAREAAVARLNAVADAATAFVKCESGQYRAYLYDQLREAVDDLTAPPPGDGAGGGEAL